MATQDTQNSDLVGIYQTLCDQQDDLSAEIQKPATTQAQAQAISTEIQEIAHRIILVQNLLFTEDSGKLSALVPVITAASTDLTTAIGQIQNVNNFLATVSSFLSDVDDAIDLAKTIAAAA
jgi:hypothetical protein